MSSSMAMWDARAALEDVAALETELGNAATNNPLRQELASIDAAQAALRPMVLVGPGYRVEDGTEVIGGAGAGGGASGSGGNTQRRILVPPTGDGTLPPLSSPRAAGQTPTLGSPRGSAPSPSTSHRGSIGTSSSSTTLSAPGATARGPSPTSSISSALDNVERLAVVENAGHDTAWYFNYFLGASHHNYVGLDDEKNGYALSVMTDEQTEPPVQRAILWRKEGPEPMLVPLDRRNELQPTDWLRRFNPAYSKWGRPREVADKAIMKELLAIEDQKSLKRFKFGVVYAKERQVLDDEFFSNEHGSADFDEFLRILGDRITLKGWTGYRAGLDVSNGQTGVNAVFTQFQGLDIMFHVSTLLPYSGTNAQQLERKRHIGNDVAVIIFQDGVATPFSPTFMRTHFNHIFIVVRKVVEDAQIGYQLTAVTKDTVPPFGPPLPNPPVITDMTLLRRLLLSKLINGETSAYTAPAFRKGMVRTTEDMLRRLYKNFVDEPQTKLAGSTDDLVSYSRELKDNVLQSRGTMRSASDSEPQDSGWRMELVHRAVDEAVLCMDSWGPSLLVATTTRLMLMTPGHEPREVLNKGSLRQLAVVPEANLLLALSGKGGTLYAIPLQILLQGSMHKNALSDYAVERAKGVHLFAVSSVQQPTDEDGLPFFQVCVAFRSSLSLFRFGAASSQRQGLAKVKDYLLPASCSVLAFCDRDRKLCVGFNTEFDAIDIELATITELYVGEAKVQPVAAIPLDDDILLCYNHRGVFRSYSGKASREYVLSWTSIPTGVAYRFPFVLAFGATGLEVRTLINGKLLQTVPAQGLQLGTSRESIYVTCCAKGQPPDIFQVLA